MTESAIMRDRPAGDNVSSDTTCGSTSKSETCNRRNINTREQTLSLIGGATLLVAGIGKGKMSGLLMTLLGGGLLYRGWTGHCHAYDALGIDTAEHPDATAIPAKQGVKVEKSLTIQKPAEELYEFWRDLENLPRVMRHLKQVEQLPGQRSRWIAKGPLGQTLEWEAEIINERDAEMISWRSLPGSSVDSAGSVHFKSLPNDRGTQVTVTMKYNPPGGRLGDRIAWLFGADLNQELADDLQHLKRMMETGEVPATAGTLSGPEQSATPQ